MKPWKKGQIPLLGLAAVFAVVWCAAALAESPSTLSPSPYYEQQIRAARLMAEATSAIRAYRLQIGIPIRPELDPNATGYIGEEFTDLTTSSGDLVAKRTATNPAFAAVMVRYFHEAGLGPGDTVAIGASGSFPSLLIATLAAAHVMNLRPVVIVSIGASMYGANLPGLSAARMMMHTARQGILPFFIAAVSMGGDNDRAEGMFFDTSQTTIRRIVDDLGVPFIHENTVAESIRLRMGIYRRQNGGQMPRCFVNIGGASPNYGNTMASPSLPNGLITRVRLWTEDPERGLVFEYAARGIPVINLINVKGLALANGIPVDPAPLPEIGVGRPYYLESRSRILAAALLVLSALSLWAARRFSRRGIRIQPSQSGPAGIF